MSGDRRPTREEVVAVAVAAYNAPRSASLPATVSERLESAINAVAESFGGFAPSPVEVPLFNLAAIAQNGHFGGSTEVAHGERDWAQIYSTIAARSNAWEEVKEVVLSAHIQQVADGGDDSYVAENLKHVLDLMFRPEMGIGPKGKP